MMKCDINYNINDGNYIKIKLNLLIIIKILNWKNKINYE